MKENFNDFRFSGLNYSSISNKYYTMNRVSGDENKIVVKVADSHLIKTKYGYALILDRTHVVFLKEWQVDENWFGNEVLLQREFFNVKEWGVHEDFGEDGMRTFDEWLNVAREQDEAVDDEGYNINVVKWSK